MIKRSRLFGILWFFAAVAWLVSVCWFAFFLQRRRRPRMMLRISAKSGYLHVGATGRFSLAEAKRTFIEMLEAVAQNKVGKVLFDGRGLEGSPEFMERFYYGKFAAETVAQFAGRGVSPSTEFAYVLEVPMRDPDRFGENVARNRGMRVTTFDHLNEALGWLGVTPANNPDAGEGK